MILFRRSSGLGFNHIHFELNREDIPRTLVALCHELKLFDSDAMYESFPGDNMPVGADIAPVCNVCREGWQTILENRKKIEQRRLETRNVLEEQLLNMIAKGENITKKQEYEAIRREARAVRGPSTITGQ